MLEIGCSSGGRSRKAVVRSGPPAFLMKTYQIVDDPNTNSIVKWGRFGESFIILDYIRFSAEILPKYFTHNNFSSFVYQLNNYGFRKIGVDHKWEYMNQDFQEGKQHLLSNMRRRSEHKPARNQQEISHKPKMVMDAINETKIEINKLKMQQMDIDFDIMELEEASKKVEEAFKKLMAFWAKTVSIVAKRGREEYGDDEGVSKSEKVVGFEKDETKPNLDGENAISFSEIQPVSPMDDPMTKSNAETIPGSFSNDLKYWKKILLGDDCEDGNGNFC